MTFLTRHVAMAICGLTVCLATASAGGQPGPHAPLVTCTNPVSGTTWQLDIDYDRRTVDSYPASVNDEEISWHDIKDGGYYTLDRKSGDLTFVAASSTGGYFLHDHCRLPP